MSVIKHQFQFGGSNTQTDDLAIKTLNGEKTATSSLYDYHLAGLQQLSCVGDLAVVLDSAGKEICTVRIDKVEIIAFKDITEQFAREEGDGNLENWLRIHTGYYSSKLAKIDKKLSPDTQLVCEWFSVI